MLFAFTQFLIKTRWLMIIIKINQRYATAILDCNQSKGGYAIMIDWRGSRWIWIHLINMRHEVEKDLACHLLTVKTSPCESLSLSEQTHEGMQFGTGLVCPADGNEAVPRDRDRESSTNFGHISISGRVILFSVRTHFSLPFSHSNLFGVSWTEKNTCCMAWYGRNDSKPNRFHLKTGNSCP